MELVRGRALQVNETNSVGGGGSRDSVAISTTHMVTFSLGSCAVLIAEDEPPVIREGDDMVVAGVKSAAGVLKPLAYVNVTRGVSSTSGGSFLWLAGGVFMLALAFLHVVLAVLWVVLPLLGADMSTDKDLPYLLGFVLGAAIYAPIGLWLWGRGSRIRKAVKMIRDASLRPT